MLHEAREALKLRVRALQARLAARREKPASDPAAS
jgi:hypothetical protein